jgi:hypothetical protein
MSPARDFHSSAAPLVQFPICQQFSHFGHSVCPSFCPTHSLSFHSPGRNLRPIFLHCTHSSPISHLRSHLDAPICSPLLLDHLLYPSLGSSLFSGRSDRAEYPSGLLPISSPHSLTRHWPRFSSRASAAPSNHLAWTQRVTVAPPRRQSGTLEDLGDSSKYMLLQKEN